MWISAAFNLKVIRTFDAVQTASPMTELEMIALMATKAAEQQRQMNALQLQVSGVTQQIEEISTGAIPPGWQTVRNLVAESGLSDGKVRALISAFHVPSKKIPFNAPGGIPDECDGGERGRFHVCAGRGTPNSDARLPQQILVSPAPWPL